MPTGTVRLHRVPRCPPERVYRAFLEADALAKWLPPHGFVSSMQEFDARAGGGFRNFSNGQVHRFESAYRTLTLHQLIEYTDRFDAPNLPGEIVVTVRLAPVVCGNDLAIEPSGLPEAIPVELCHLGWQDSLEQLAHVVGPDIPGGLA